MQGHGGKREKDRNRSHILFFGPNILHIEFAFCFIGLSLLPAVRQLFVNFPLFPISVWKQQIDFK